jgi:hypothetical protein
MSTYIHLNHIKDEELVSSSPIRSHIIVPAIIVILVLSTLLWWLFESMTYTSLLKLQEQHDSIKSQLHPGYLSALDLRAQEQELEAMDAQLRVYRDSKLFFGRALAKLPEHVLPNIQFTKLEVPPPPAPLFQKNEKRKDQPILRNPPE